MKIVVVGGTGLIGAKVVGKLKQKGHEAIAAAPNTGVNTITGEGLADALAGAQVVVDVANSPSFEDQAAMDFFQTAGKNLATTEVAAGIKHHVALSVVGTERLLDSGYFRAKLAQEKLIKNAPIPYTIVRATQFFEFLRGIAQSAIEGDTVRLSHSLFQPMAAEDVATAVAEAAVAEPVNGTIEIAGPDAFHIDEIVGKVLEYDKDRAEGRCGSGSTLFRCQTERSVAHSRPQRAPRLDQVRLVAHPRPAAAAEKVTVLIRNLKPTQPQRRRRTMKKTALLLTAAAALLATSVAAQETIAPGANVSVVFDQELPNVPGKSMRAVLVEYEPGAGSPSHRHPSSAFIYARVLEGAIRSKVNDEPERTYQAGESWTEKPGDHHQVSHNASNTEPAKLLAIFVVDTSDRNIVIPDK